MEVQYESVNYKGNTEIETQSVAQFLYDELLYEERYNSLSRDKIRLEDQPGKVVEALGRLVSIMLDKNILSLEDLKTISDVGWGRKGDTLKLKKEEE